MSSTTAPSVPAFEFSYWKSVDSIAPALSLSTASALELAALSATGDSYRETYIEVRGKWRTIRVPSERLGNVQRRINYMFFPAESYLAPAVHGFVRFGSTKANAAKHVGNPFLQKLDILDFFESVTNERVREALQLLGLGEPAAQLIADLTTCNNRLPLGAPTSPLISNLVLREFDIDLLKLIEGKGITYTRYADDLAFSSIREFDIQSDVARLLGQRGLGLNPRKCHKFKLGQPMFVTGLSVSNQSHPRLRARFKKMLRTSLFFVEKHGIRGHAEYLRENTARSAAKLAGRLRFAASVEPLWADKMKSSYPNAFEQLLPSQPADKISRLNARRAEFCERVRSRREPMPSMYVPNVVLF